MIIMFRYWPILSRDHSLFSAYQAPKTLDLGDGGNYENTGLLPLLQRGVRKCICLVNAGTEIDMNFQDNIFIADLTPPTESTDAPKKTDQDHEKQYTCADTQLLALFGAVEEIKLGYNYAHNQVFPLESLNDVMHDFLNNMKAGRGAISKRRLKVLDNPVWNIVGDYEVDVLFVYNSLCQNFIDKLPEETKSEIGKKEGSFENYPYYKTTNQNLRPFSLDNDEVSLLAAQAAFMMSENAAQLKSLIEGED